MTLTDPDPRTADGMTDTQVIALVRETLGEPVAQAAKAVLDAIGPSASSDLREKLVLTRVDHGTWSTVNHTKKSFEDAIEEKKNEADAKDVEVLEVQVIRRAKVSRTVASSVEFDT